MSERVTVHLSGPVTITRLSDVHAPLAAAIEAGARDLTVDLAEVDTIDSAGLAVLVNTFKELKARGGTLNLVNASEQVRIVLSRSHLDKIFLIDGAIATDW